MSVWRVWDKYLKYKKYFIDHIHFSLKHRMLDIMDKKAAYAAGKDE